MFGPRDIETIPQLLLYITENFVMRFCKDACDPPNSHELTVDRVKGGWGRGHIPVLLSKLSLHRDNTFHSVTR